MLPVLFNQVIQLRAGLLFVEGREGDDGFPVRAGPGPGESIFLPQLSAEGDGIHAEERYMIEGGGAFQLSGSRITKYIGEYFRMGHIFLVFSYLRT
jgi:hypothetical protein